MRDRCKFKLDKRRKCAKIFDAFYHLYGVYEHEINDASKLQQNIYPIESNLYYLQHITEITL